MGTPQPILVLSNIIIDDLWLADGTHHPGTLGGAGVYAAVGAALWWSDVAIVTGVGADLIDETKNQLSSFGLRQEGQLVRAEHSIQSKLVYLPNGQRTETPTFGCDHFDALQVTPRDIPEGLLPAAGTYIFRDLNPAFWAATAESTSQLGTVIWELQDDAAHANLWLEIRQYLALVHLFSLNLSEAGRLFGTTEPDLVLDQILDTGVGAAILRMGGDGAAVATPDRRFRLVPPASDVVDVTGGGNAFTGGFLAGWLAHGGDPEAAARCAAGSAAHALAQYGPANPRDHALAAAWAGDTRIIPQEVPVPENAQPTR